MPGSRKPARRAPRRRWRQITDADETLISQIIADLRGPRITWQVIVAAVEQDLDQRWSRQALEAREEIKKAYLLKRAGQGPAPGVDPAQALLLRRIDSLKARVVELEGIVSRYDELFIRHHYNAELRGISIADLERPLDKVDKGQTDDPPSTAPAARQGRK